MATAHELRRALQELRTGKFATQEEAVKALDDLFIANAVHPKHLGKPEDHDVSFSLQFRLFILKMHNILSCLELFVRLVLHFERLS